MKTPNYRLYIGGKKSRLQVLSDANEALESPASEELKRGKQVISPKGQTLRSPKGEVLLRGPGPVVATDQPPVPTAVDALRLRKQGKNAEADRMLRQIAGL